MNITPRDFVKGQGMNIVERLRAQGDTEAADTIEALAEALNRYGTHSLDENDCPVCDALRRVEES